MESRLEKYLDQKRDEINLALDGYLEPDDYCPPILIEAMRYSALAPGKRIRPILTIACAELVGSSSKKVMPSACAVELVHTFSLIHDDLPTLDNDSMRRGRPTCHIKYGEAIALLAGDALFAMAFRLIGKNLGQCTNEAVCVAFQVLSVASGVNGMVAGQVMDIISEGEPAQAHILEYIHKKKTAALIEASCWIGSALGEASDEQERALIAFGGQLGIAFQIIDDILNVTGDPEKMGKEVGSDAGRGKQTYPMLYGLEESRRRAHGHIHQAKSYLQIFGEKAEVLNELADYSLERIH